MPARPRLSPDETRLRIMDVAEEQFRRVGYAKSTVADIAEALSMSSANVYRFFASKGAINDAICRRMLDQCHAHAESVLAGPGTAAQRLRQLILDTHHRNQALMVGERRIHDMVEVAMAESWDAVEEHVHCMEGFIARLVREGQERGEFARDLDADAMGETIFDCCCTLFHPTLLAQHCQNDVPSNPERIVEFVLRALRA
jgi:AcrR family transcriptional regulator